MKAESLFYTFGGIFGIAAILYFTWEYLIHFPKEVKLVLLICLTIAFFFAARILKERDI